MTIKNFRGESNAPVLLTEEYFFFRTPPKINLIKLYLNGKLVKTKSRETCIITSLSRVFRGQSKPGS